MTNNRLLRRVSTLLKYIFLWTITLMTLIPFLWIFMSSFKSNKEILSSAIALPTSLSIEGYLDAFSTAPLLNYYFNSIIVVVTSTLLGVFLIGMAAYVIARCEFRLKNIIFITLSVSLLLPVTALIYPIYTVIRQMGLYDTRSGLMLVNMGLGLPTTLYILRSYFLSIPKELEEAAYIDGSGFFHTYLKIMIPIAKPGFATAAVLQFILGWNEFLFALVLTDSKEVRTVPLAINYFLSQFSFDYRALFAAIVIITIPSIIAFIALQEQVVDSLAAGSVKG